MQKRNLVIPILACGLAALISACTFISPVRYFALGSSPEKIATTSDTALAQSARAHFWQDFHAGRYDQLPALTSELTAAYLETSTDPGLARLLALTHLWTISERRRTKGQDPRVTESALLAEKYFGEALRLEPSDHRLPGFLGITRLVNGNIHADAKLSTDGYLTIQDGVAAFPEFNLFVLSTGLGQLTATDARFDEGVEAIWRNFEICAKDTINRTPSLEQLSTNTEITPHNLEGFFLQWGDLLIKQGKGEIAKSVYEQAKLVDEYPNWPFKSVLETRIGSIAALRPGVRNNQQEVAASGSAISCMMCHQAK
jgi:hypothetical protein